jgi:hypothetical protein
MKNAPLFRFSPLSLRNDFRRQNWRLKKDLYNKADGVYPTLSCVPYSLLLKFIVCYLSTFHDLSIHFWSLLIV